MSYGPNEREQEQYLAFYGPGQKTNLEPEFAWDVVAKDFEDLAARLGC